MKMPENTLMHMLGIDYRGIYHNMAFIFSAYENHYPALDCNRGKLHYWLSKQYVNIAADFVDLIYETVSVDVDTCSIYTHPIVIGENQVSMDDTGTATMYRAWNAYCLHHLLQIHPPQSFIQTQKRRTT